MPTIILDDPDLFIEPEEVRESSTVIQVDMTELLKEEYTSNVLSIAGFDWKVKVAVIDDYVSVWLKISPVENARHWKLNADFEVFLDTAPEIMIKQQLKLCDSNVYMDKSLLGTYEYLNIICSKKFQQPHLRLHVNFVPTHTEGVHPRMRWPLSERSNPLADLKVLIDGRIIAVPMEFLAFKSEFFRSLAYGSLNALINEKGIVQLDNVTYYEFVHWLQVALPGGGYISEENCEAILIAAREFQSDEVKEAVDDFICGDYEMNIGRKFQLAIRYNLLKMKAVIEVAMQQDLNMVKHIINSPNYKTFHSKEKSALMDYIAENRFV